MTPDIRERILKKGAQNRPGRSNPCRYITIHETANTKAGADAAAHAAYLANTTQKVSWHFTVDDHEIWQHLPGNEDAFHAGDGNGAGNRTSIGIELCVNRDGNFEQTLKNGAWLVKQLMQRHHIPPANVVQHHYWSGKNCPMTLRNTNRWEEWKTMIRKELSVKEALESLYAKGVINSPEYWEEAVGIVKNLDLLLVKMAQALL